MIRIWVPPFKSLPKLAPPQTPVSSSICCTFHSFRICLIHLTSHGDYLRVKTPSKPSNFWREVMLLVGKIHQNPAKRTWSPENKHKTWFVHPEMILGKSMENASLNKTSIFWLRVPTVTCFRKVYPKIEPKNSLGQIWASTQYRFWSQTHRSHPHQYRRLQAGAGWTQPSQQGNEEKHGDPRTHGIAAGIFIIDSKVPKREKGVSSREVEFRLYLKQGQGLDTFRLYPKNTHTWIPCYLEKNNGWIRLISGI